jgi:hypothetical protein
MASLCSDVPTVSVSGWKRHPEFAGIPRQVGVTVPDPLKIEAIEKLRLPTPPCDIETVGDEYPSTKSLTGDTTCDVEPAKLAFPLYTAVKLLGLKLRVDVLKVAVRLPPSVTGTEFSKVVPA